MRKVRVLGNEKGFIKFFFVTALLAFSIYAGVKFGMPYYRYSAFKSDLTELARISLGDSERTKMQVLEKAEEYHIPISADELTVTKKDKTVRVQTSWSETVDLLGFYQKKLDFDIDVEE
jgi:hypothetical protein